MFCYTIGVMNEGRLQRWEARIDKTDTCWLWTGHLNHKGYARLGGDSAHRLAYEHFVGPIPEGLTIDHICEVKRCVNPDHLRVMERGENARIAIVKREFCPNGHERTEENLVWRTMNGRRVRMCRECEKARRRRHYASHIEKHREVARVKARHRRSKP
jgi:HNH endonuclease